MHQKLKPYEAHHMQTIRDEARQFAAEEFPNARVAIHIGRGADGQLGVRADIIGDPSPHSPEEIGAYLSEIGVAHIAQTETHPTP